MDNRLSSFNIGCFRFRASIVCILVWRNGRRPKSEHNTSPTTSAHDVAISLHDAVVVDFLAIDVVKMSQASSALVRNAFGI